MTGLQCHKALWLHKYQPELKDEQSPEQAAILDFGAEVGRYAQELFPGGILVPYCDLSHSQQLAMTRNAISNGASTIYEGAFSYNDVFIKADILHLGPDGWELYEVKSSASLKEHYPDDIAIQYYVISGTGLPLAKACLVHLNTDYVRQGPIDVEQLFTDCRFDRQNPGNAVRCRSETHCHETDVAREYAGNGHQPKSPRFMPAQPRASFRDAAFECASIFIDYIYDQIEKRRRRATKQMLDTAREAATLGPDEFRKQFLSYLEESSFTQAGRRTRCPHKPARVVRRAGERRRCGRHSQTPGSLSAGS